MSNNLVVYYSWTGNTKVLAEEIHTCIGGDVRRIEKVKEKKAGKGPGFFSAAMGAVFGLKSRLKPMDYTMGNYDNIFLGAQVWAGKSTPPINAFLSKADFKGKNVYLFITKADDKVPQTIIDSLTEKIGKKGGKVKDSLSITTKMETVIKPEDVAGAVRDWIGRLAV